KRIRQMNEERVRLWGDKPEIERRLIPVSVKTRLGYDSVVITDWVQELLELEPHVISIHGRTLAQHYKGEADWDAIAAAAEIVRKTNTLIFGNGDIQNLYQAAQRIRDAEVNGVLIGRASFGNPWLFRERDQLKKLLNSGCNPTMQDLPEAAPSREERLLMALEHARVHAKLKGEDHFVELRKHMGWYLGHFRGAKRIRNELVRINSLADVERIIMAALEEQDDEGEDGLVTPQEEMHFSERDLTCAY
ncbi:MAG TPA: tRNA-dihydrouridine synthase, partial [Ktedonobacteraceae bacterium]|nr:tRNA-dihydrouridine synthase [Ktedonobacteraceae bacterium]